MSEISEFEYMTLGEARDYLGVSKRKVAQLVERGTLPAEENPLDARSKIVRRGDVEALKRKVPHGAARKGTA